MALTREQTLRIRNFLDDWLPPRCRESKVLMYPLLWAVFGRRFRTFATFKERGFSMSERDFAGVYESTADLQQIQGCTDLNQRCEDAILGSLVGATVLDAGCGRGHLVERIAPRVSSVTGVDIVIPQGLIDHDNVVFDRGSVQALRFDDDAFDTVVSTHTLEHVQDIRAALAELRRVAAKRVIIVVPKERPYRYSFNLHLHFFPHSWSWEAVAGCGRPSRLADLGDWFYVEDQ